MSTLDKKQLFPENSSLLVQGIFTPWASANLLVVCITIDWPERIWTIPPFFWEFEDSLTQAWTVQSSGWEWFTEIWYMLNPPIITDTIWVPNDWWDNVQVCVSTYISSFGAFELDVVSQTGAISADPSLSITPTWVWIIVDSLFTWYRNVVWWNNQVLLYANDTGSEWNAYQYYLNSWTDPITMSYTQVSDDWGLIAVAFKEVYWPPTVALNTPTATEFTTSQPTLEYTWTNLDLDDIRYNIQISDNNIFAWEITLDSSFLDTDSNYWFGSSYDYWESFISNWWVLWRISIKLWGTSLIWNMVVSLYTHSWTYWTSSIPWVLLAVSEIVDASILVNTRAFIDFDFIWDNKITLIDWTYYCLVFKLDTDSIVQTELNNTNNYNWNFFDNHDWRYPSSDVDMLFAVYTWGGFLLNKVSWTDLGFANVDTPADTDPFNNWDKCDYDVQSVDSLPDWTYYWRVKWLAPDWSNIYWEWSDIYSFTINTTGGGWTSTNFQLNVWDTWKVVEGMQINIWDEWKPVVWAWINVWDDWKQIYTSE